MKTIGMLGGMSWESTVTYYQIVNKEAAKKLGGLHSARVLLHSVDFAGLEANMAAGDWDANADILIEAAKGLVGAGAGMMVICTNTMHKVADQVAAAIPVPLLHIADATADELTVRKMESVALLGTKYTMQQEFYRQKLWDRGFEVLLPTDWQMDELNRIIFEELCLGKLTETARAFLLALIDELAGQGAQGVVLGCTELPLLVQQKDTPVPLFDTTEIHGRRAALMAFED